MSETEDSQERIISFREHLGIDASKIDEASQVARRLYDEKKYEGARAIFRGLAAMDPLNLDHLRLYAAASVAAGDNVAAIDAIDASIRMLDIVDEEPRFKAELLAFKANVLVRSERKKEAHRVAEEAMALGPKDAPWRASLQKSIDDLDVSLKLTLSRDPHTDFSDVMNERIEEVLDEGRSLAWAFGYSDNEMLSLHADAIKLVRQGNLASARRILEGLCALDATVPLFHTSLGTVCELLGDLEAAEICFDNAVTVSDGVPDGEDLVASARLRRGVFHAYYGDSDVAREDLSAAIGAPSVPEEDKDEARKALEALDQADSDNPPNDRPDNPPGAADRSNSASPRGPPSN